ncbi:hypothetical protein SO802_034107 [Lithocarpus litseifolius]|uniref:Cytochrome P450 n=1 Tax=Lithocarpus litseifolius TaxID=425828 RepID=A0AAW2BFN6_9ROSI
MTQLKALLMDIVVAGGETTSIMVEWVMAELMHHPQVMRKVHEELAKSVGLDSLVEESHLPKLHYLDVVIKETFRLHPPFPFLVPRCPSQSSTIGGYYIPKGTMVWLNVWAILRDPKIWKNPLEFQPERFLNDSSNFNYFPSGSGRRICSGLPLAERTLIYILASLLHSFEWKLPHDTELEFSDNFGIGTKKLHPAVALPTPRLSNFELYAK